MAKLIPCLEVLFDEFDTIAPQRGKKSDGWIGDSSHAAAKSDHNPDETGNTPERDADKIDEVHAIDVDKHLREDTFDMEDCVQYLLSECRKAGTSGKDRGRLKYIIYNRRIWEAPNWNQQTYKGSNAHTEHAHVSAEYDTASESDTRTWGLVEKFGDIVDAAQEDRIALKAATKAAQLVWDKQLLRPDGPDKKGNATSSAGTYQRYTDVVVHEAEARLRNQINAVSAQVAAINKQLVDLTNLLTSHASGIIEASKTEEV